MLVCQCATQFAAFFGAVRDNTKTKDNAQITNQTFLQLRRGRI